MDEIQIVYHAEDISLHLMPVHLYLLNMTHNE